MHVERGVLALAAAAAVGVACGQQPPNLPYPVASIAPSPPVRAVANLVAPPPNAQGDPACPGPTAWGRHPDGVGVLVSYWSEGTATVTVLVRTVTGNDRAQAALLERDELRLYEFPDVDNAAVREVLLMTDTRRCFVLSDPATFG